MKRLAGIISREAMMNEDITIEDGVLTYKEGSLAEKVALKDMLRAMKRTVSTPKGLDYLEAKILKEKSKVSMFHNFVSNRLTKQLLGLYGCPTMEITPAHFMRLRHYMHYVQHRRGEQVRKAWGGRTTRDFLLYKLRMFKDEYAALMATEHMVSGKRKWLAIHLRGGE